MVAWFAAGFVSLVLAGAALGAWSRWQRMKEAARILEAIAAEDLAELSLLLLERTALDSVAEWFGDPAVIILVKSRQAESFIAEAMELLVSEGADVDETGVEGKTALMHAAAEGQCEICRLLLSHGARPDARDTLGRTAAEWAERGGHPQMVRLLRKSEASA